MVVLKRTMGYTKKIQMESLETKRPASKYAAAIEGRIYGTEKFVTSRSYIRMQNRSRRRSIKTIKQH